jgi:hypothetical protein
MTKTVVYWCHLLWHGLVRYLYCLSAYAWWLCFVISEKSLQVRPQSFVSPAVQRCLWLFWSDFRESWGGGWNPLELWEHLWVLLWRGWIITGVMWKLSLFSSGGSVGIMVLSQPSLGRPLRVPLSQLAALRWVASQMTPYSLYSALLWTRAHRAMVKRSALCRE